MCSLSDGYMDQMRHFVNVFRSNHQYVEMRINFIPTRNDLDELMKTRMMTTPHENVSKNAEKQSWRWIQKRKLIFSIRCVSPIASCIASISRWCKKVTSSDSFKNNWWNGGSLFSLVRTSIARRDKHKKLNQFSSILLATSFSCSKLLRSWRG